jgi:hypothetical protein
MQLIAPGSGGRSHGIVQDRTVARHGRRIAGIGTAAVFAIPETLLAIADKVIQMKRRAFIAGLGSAAALASAALAQQPVTRMVVYLSPRSAEAESEFLTAFRRGLRETGHIEGKNLTIEYRWADGR